MIDYQDAPVAEANGYWFPRSAEANARLIAAAPELLEACKEMVAAEGADGATSLRFLQACNSARAAIAKAEKGE